MRANKKEYELLTKDVDVLQKQVRQVFGGSTKDKLVDLALVQRLISYVVILRSISCQ